MFILMISISFILVLAILFFDNVRFDDEGYNRKFSCQFSIYLLKQRTISLLSLLLLQLKHCLLDNHFIRTSAMKS